MSYAWTLWVLAVGAYVGYRLASGVAAACQRRAPQVSLEQAIHVRRNWFVECAPELLITRAEDGALEIEGYAIMPVETYVRLTEGRTC